mgnify:CR=1 FL=1
MLQSSLRLPHSGTNHQSDQFFYPMITHEAPAAIHPDHGRMSSSFRYNRQPELAHIQFLPPPAHSLSVPRCLRRTQDDVAHRLPAGSHASEDFTQRKSPVLCTR